MLSWDYKLLYCLFLDTPFSSIYWLKLHNIEPIWAATENQTESTATRNLFLSFLCFKESIQVISGTLAGVSIIVNYLVNLLLNKRANIDSLREISLAISNQTIFSRRVGHSKAKTLFPPALCFFFIYLHQSNPYIVTESTNKANHRESKSQDWLFLSTSKELQFVAFQSCQAFCSTRKGACGKWFKSHSSICVRMLHC